MFEKIRKQPNYKGSLVMASKEVGSAAKRISDTKFPVSKGETSSLIRNFKWSKTGLGPIELWPQSLKTSVDLILYSPMPMVLLWGKDGIMIYNDAYSVFAGKKHPRLLGSKVLEGWPEVADFNKKVMEKVLKGSTLSYVGQQLTLYRNNSAEDVWMDLSYSPVIDESGNPAGVLAIVSETTKKISAEKKQQKTGERLKLEQRKFYDLFMRTPAGVAILTGPDLVFELANKKYKKLVGVNREIIGKSLSEAIPDLELSLRKIINKVAFKGERFAARELPVMIDWDNTGNPYTKYLDLIYEPIYENNKPNGLIVFVNNISEQVIARQRVEDQNKVLEMMASGGSLSEGLEFLIKSIEKHSGNGMKGSILLTDDSGKHLRHGAGPSLPKKYNKAVDGLTIGENYGSCGTAAYRKKSVYVSDINKDELWKDFKDLAAKYNLRSCWSTPIFSSNKKLLGTFAVYFDKPRKPNKRDKQIISFATKTAALLIERKKAEVELKESEERLRFLAESMPQKVSTSNAKGEILYINKEWTEYTGAPFESLKGMGWKKFVHPEDLDEFNKLWKKSVESGEPFIFRYRYRRHDGDYRWHLSRARAMRDSKGKIVRWFSSITDIQEVIDTAQKKNELEEVNQALKEQRMQLMELNEAKDEFISLASHQLRTPATAVKQYLGLVLQGYQGDVPEEQRKFLEIANESNERQINIVDDLLKVAQIDSGKIQLIKKRINLTKLINEVISVHSHKFNTLDQVVTFKHKDKKVYALADRVKLRMVIDNLIDNASKYSGEGKQINIELIERKKYISVIVSDEGIGIGKKDMNKLFQKFSRLESHISVLVGGTGLGLYIVKKIIELHEGTVEVESKLKKGTTFTIKLPN